MMDSSARKDFPPLQSLKQRGKDKGGKRRKAATFVSSKNKFEVLNGVGSEASEELRKPRVASLCVATLLQEMKAKKSMSEKATDLPGAEKVHVRVPEVGGQTGSVANSQ
ncbi:hypothetical protein V6N13_030762 [Hibiscus sabdariffa]